MSPVVRTQKGLFLIQATCLILGHLYSSTQVLGIAAIWNITDFKEERKRRGEPRAGREVQSPHREGHCEGGTKILCEKYNIPLTVCHQTQFANIFFRILLQSQRLAYSFMKVTQSCPTLCKPKSMEFSRPEHWSGQPFPSPGDLSNPGIKPRCPELEMDSLPTELSGKPIVLQFLIL